MSTLEKNYTLNQGDTIDFELTFNETIPSGVEFIYLLYRGATEVKLTEVDITVSGNTVSFRVPKSETVGLQGVYKYEFRLRDGVRTFTPYKGVKAFNPTRARFN